MFILVMALSMTGANTMKDPSYSGEGKIILYGKRRKIPLPSILELILTGFTWLFILLTKQKTYIIIPQLGD